MTTSTVRSISPVDPCALPSNLLGTHKEYEDHEVEAYEVQVGDSVEIVYVTWYSQPSPGVLGRAGVSIGAEAVWVDADSPEDAIETKRARS